MSEPRGGKGRGPGSILITGAGGYIRRADPGRPWPPACAMRSTPLSTIIALDVREVPDKNRLEGVQHLVCDIRDNGLTDIMAQHRVEAGWSIWPPS